MVLVYGNSQPVVQWHPSSPVGGFPSKHDQSQKRVPVSATVAGQPKSRYHTIAYRLTACPNARCDNRCETAEKKEGNIWQCCTVFGGAPPSRNSGSCLYIQIIETSRHLPPNTQRDTLQSNFENPSKCSLEGVWFGAHGDPCDWSWCSVGCCQGSLVLAEQGCGSARVRVRGVLVHTIWRRW